VSNGFACTTERVTVSSESVATTMLDMNMSDANTPERFLSWPARTPSGILTFA
jgi:hypothetical protein